MLQCIDIYQHSWSSVCNPVPNCTRVNRIKIENLACHCERLKIYPLQTRESGVLSDCTCKEYMKKRERERETEKCKYLLPHVHFNRLIDQDCLIRPRTPGLLHFICNAGSTFWAIILQMADPVPVFPYPVCLSASDVNDLLISITWSSSALMQLWILTHVPKPGGLLTSSVPSAVPFTLLCSSASLAQHSQEIAASSL